MSELVNVGPLQALREVLAGAGGAGPGAILGRMTGSTRTMDEFAPPLAVPAPKVGSAAAAVPPVHESLQEAQLRAWLAAIQRQDENALADLYDATVARVYGLALRITRSRETAEEVAEDVYMQVWRDAGRFDPQRGVGVLGWLLVICRSRALDALRRTDSAEAHPDPETLVAELAGEEGPESLLQAAQQHSALHAALNTLNATQRQLLALAFFRGMTHDEIAAHVSLPLGTVKSHIRRALLALKEQFEAARELSTRKKTS